MDRAGRLDQFSDLMEMINKLTESQGRQGSKSGRQSNRSVAEMCGLGDWTVKEQKTSGGRLGNWMEAAKET